MAPGSCAYRSSCVNIPANPAGKLDELAGAQGLARGSNAKSNKAPTKASTLPKAFTPPLISPPTEDLFNRFIKVFMETTQAQALAEPRERSLKARTPKTYFGKSYIDCYHFCQQYEDYFETSGTTEMNRTLFVAIFLRSTVSLRWTQHKHCHKNATPIT